MHPSRTKMHHRKPTTLSFYSKSKLFWALMASLAVLTLFSLLLFFSLSSATRNHHRKDPKPSLASIPPEIRQACKATRYPETCEASLAQPAKFPPNPTPNQIIHSAICVSADNIRSGQEMVRAILESAGANPNRSTAAKSCTEVLRNSAYRTQSAVDALPRGKIKDARAWMSASLLYQYDCWNTLKYVNDSRQINDTMAFLQSLVGLTSNALSMVMAYDNFGDNVASWKPPMTERDGFWERGGGSGDAPGFRFPAGLTADVTVCKGGGGKCDYEKVQEAVDAAPGNLTGKLFVIGIKEGVYEEIVRVPLEKTNLVFLGDGMGKTVITGSLNVGQIGVTTYTSATVAVLGDGFMASGLTIQNTAGPDAHQAVAFRSDSDLSIIENCEFLGNQDTLYAHSLRQFYKSCVIQGNVDFIFGNSASVFQDCTILVRPRQLKPEKGETNAITAHGRTDPAQSTGFVFQNCSVNGTDAYMALYKKNPKVHKNFLGRPWKEYSRTVFIRCNLEQLISPPGWLPWSGDFALKTLYYGEFENSGAGANADGRVSWSSQIPPERVSAYSVENFIQGDEWISNYVS